MERYSGRVRDSQVLELGRMEYVQALIVGSMM